MNTLDTIEHILLQCPRFHDARIRCTHNLYKDASSQFTMLNLLGFVDYLPLSSVRSIILKHTATFLQQVIAIRQL